MLGPTQYFWKKKYLSSILNKRKLGSYTDNRTAVWVGERGQDKNDPMKEQYMVLHRICSVAINNRQGGRIFSVALWIL